MRVATQKTIENNKKTRITYAIAAIERDSYSDDNETERNAIKAMSRMINKEMGKNEMTDWALRQQEYILLTA